MADATQMAAERDGDGGVEGNDGVGVYDAPHTDPAGGGVGSGVEVSSEGHQGTDDGLGDEWVGRVSLNRFMVTHSDVEECVREQLGLDGSADMTTTERQQRQQQLLCALVCSHIAYYGEDIILERNSFAVKDRRGFRYMKPKEMQAAIEHLAARSQALKNIFGRVYEDHDAKTMRQILTQDATAFLKHHASSTKRNLMDILRATREKHNTKSQAQGSQLRVLEVPAATPSRPPPDGNEQAVSQLMAQLRQVETTLKVEQLAHAATKAELDMLRAEQGKVGGDEQQDDALWAGTVVAAVGMVRAVQSQTISNCKRQALDLALEKELAACREAQSATHAKLAREMSELQQQLADAAKKQQDLCAGANHGDLAGRLHGNHITCQTLLTKIEKQGVMMENEEKRNQGFNTAYNRAWRENLKRLEDNVAGVAIPGMWGLKAGTAPAQPRGTAYSDVVRGAPGAWSGIKYAEWTEQKEAEQIVKRKAVDAVVKECVGEEAVYDATVHSADQGSEGKSKRQIRAFLSARQAQDLFGRDMVNGEGNFRYVHYRGTGRRVSATQVFLNVPQGLAGDIPRTVQVKLRNKFSWRIHQALLASTWREAVGSPAPIPTWH